jgi:hypothetical protein
MWAPIAIGAAIVIALAFFFRRRDTGYKVDEFARARSLTTEWARRAEQQPAAEAPRNDSSLAEGERSAD